MAFARLHIVLALVIATALSGLMAAGHADALSAPVDHAMSDMAADGPTDCCDAAADRSQGCHLLVALIPAAGTDTGAANETRTIPIPRCASLAGRTPPGPSDPPRFA